MNQKKVYLVFAFLIAIALVTTPLMSQKFSRGKGRIGGKVVDVESNPIVKAKVELVFEDEVTKLTTETDSKGNWAMLGLGSGQFRVTASAEGYIPVYKMIQVSQLKRNPKMQHILKKAKQPIVNEEMIGFLEEGNRLYKDRKFDEAIASFQKILDKHPKMLTILFKVGDCYREKGEHDKGVEIYQKVIAIAKEKENKSIQAQALGNIGAICFAKNELEKANSYFQQAIDIDPKDEILAYNVAEINFNNNNVDAAIKYYKLASSIKPEWGEPHIKLGYSYLNKGDFTAAKASFKKFLELQPEGQQAQIVKELLASLP